MDIVAIMGSPRKHGNTDMLLDEMIKGAEENGHNVKKYYIRIWKFILAELVEFACKARTVFLMMMD